MEVRAVFIFLRRREGRSPPRRQKNKNTTRSGSSEEGKGRDEEAYRISVGRRGGRMPDKETNGNSVCRREAVFPRNCCSDEEMPESRYSSDKSFS